MRIVISKAYQKWAKANKVNAESFIEPFLFRVFNSADITNVTPQPKSVGSNLRKIPGVVDEFTLNKKYRVYSKCLEFRPGVSMFYLATVGSKGVTKQNDDIKKALSIFDDINAIEWENWEPTPEQIKEFSVPEVQVIDEAPHATVPVQKPATKKKGKPVDENGLTPAERKTLRKKAEQEERRKCQEEKQRRQQEEAQKRKQEQEEEEKRRAADVANQQKAVVKQDDKDSSAVVLNGVPMPTPQQITGDVTFQDVAQVQYELELIEHQIKIEQLQMEIIRQNIAMAQHEIALEQLVIKKLNLLQMQKAQSIQK